MAKTKFPLRVIRIDLSEQPQTPIELGVSSTSLRYQGALVYVHDAERPLAVVEVDSTASTIDATDVVKCAKAQHQFEQASRRVLPTVSSPSESVSVIIATRNRPEMLRRCLDSLMRQSFQNFDVVVVDNCPSDNSTKQMVVDTFGADARVKYVREDIPGLAIAHNCGLDNSKGEILCITDDDVVADSHWIERLVASFGTSPQVGCVSGLILPFELETLAQVWTERHGGFGKGLLPKSFDLTTNRGSGALFPFTAGQFGSGANMAFRRRVLKAFGCFNPALGAGTYAMGGDDLASFYATITHGFRINYEPAAIVWHTHRRDEVGMANQAFNYGRGLGAYLTSVVHDRPTKLFALAFAAPAGLLHMFGAKGQRNQRLPEDYPKGLKRAEMRGILSGVPAYFRSRRKTPATYWKIPQP